MVRKEKKKDDPPDKVPVKEIYMEQTVRFMAASGYDISFLERAVRRIAVFRENPMLYFVMET